MQINLMTIGNKMPSWVNEGFSEYCKRLPRDYQLNLIEIPAQPRIKNSNIEKIILEEGNALLAKIPKGNKIIVLEVTGKQLTTEQLATQLQNFHDKSCNISLLIGGPEGLSQTCLNAAEMKWSLSNLTFPHPLVRVIIAEQIYRAYSIITHHPYHRA